MKNLLKYLLLLLMVFLPLKTKAVATNAAYSNIKIYYFYEDKNEDYEKDKKWLEDSLNNSERIRITEIDIKSDNKLYEAFKNNLNIKKDNLPLIVIGNNYFLGLDKRNQSNLTEAIEAYENSENYCNLGDSIQNKEDVSNCLKINEGIYEQPKEINILIYVVGILIILGIGIGIYIVVRKKKSKQ